MEAMVTAVTGAVDYAAIVTGIGTVAAAVAVAYVAMRGAGLILSALRK